MLSRIIFRQLFEPLSSTYTYLLACPSTGKAILIDPVLETAERDAKLIDELELDLIYGANTHVHADHITGTGKLKEIFPEMKSVLSKSSGSLADIFVKDGSTLEIGNISLEVRSTPGHTNSCLTYVSHDDRLVFTGDALLIRGCGRTDFQEGDPKTLYESIHQKIFTLPDDYALLPGHDYQGLTMSSVGEEKKHNSRVIKSSDEFVKIMKNLKLDMPKQIDKAIPANKVCGVFELMVDHTKKFRPKS